MKTNSIPRLYILVPCYNEEEVLEDSAGIIRSVLEELIQNDMVDSNSKILFVDDGSSDRTWEIICGLHEQWEGFLGIRLSRNRGHQIALFAGMEVLVSDADAIISIDADLQQDVKSIRDFVEKYLEGYDIIYGVRNDRNSDGFLKKTTASVYYKLLKWLGCEIVEQSADYRLMSKRATKALLQYGESNLFIRGMIPTLGFPSSIVRFDVSKRSKGTSKYTLRKMLRLAIDGITSFSMMPLRLFFFIGAFVSIGSFFLMIYYLISFFVGTTVSGWTSLSMIMLFLGGIELLGIGTIGEYVGRTYMESKKRPRFFIEAEVGNLANGEKEINIDE